MTDVVGSQRRGPARIRVKPIALFFWGLVLVTLGVSYRFGAMTGLIFFLFVLMTGVELLSKWAGL